MKFYQKYIKDNFKFITGYITGYYFTKAISLTIVYIFQTKVLKILTGSHAIKDENHNHLYTFKGTDNNTETVKLKDLFIETLNEFDAEFKTSFNNDYEKGHLKFYFDPTLTPNAYAAQSLFRERKSVTITQGLLYALDNKIDPDPLNDNNDEYETDLDQKKYFNENYKKPDKNDQINLIEIKKNVLKSILLHELGHLKNKDVKTRMKISYLTHIPLIGQLIVLVLPSFLYQKQELKADQATILKKTRKDYCHELILGLRAMERFVEESRPSNYPLFKYLGRKIKESLSKGYRKLKSCIFKREYNHEPPRQKTISSSYSIPKKQPSFLERLTRTHPYTETRAEELATYRRRPAAAA